MKRDFYGVLPTKISNVVVSIAFHFLSAFLPLLICCFVSSYLFLCFFFSFIFSYFYLSFLLFMFLFLSS